MMLKVWKINQRILRTMLTRSKKNPSEGLPNGQQDKSSLPDQEKNDNLKQTALLQELFIKELQDMLWTEQHLLKLGKELQRAVSDPLGIMLAKYITESVIHAQRLSGIFEQLLSIRPSLQKCQGMAGLIAEADLLIEHTHKITAIRDIATIIVMQKINHYKIASYEAMITLAEMRDQVLITQLLMDNLREEKESGENMTAVFTSLTAGLKTSS